MALGVQALASSDLRRRVRPLLRTLARETGETATLEVPFEDSMLILDEVAGNIGTRWPIHATSTGKVLLAFDESGIDRLDSRLKPLTKSTLTDREALRPQLAEARRLGYATSLNELEDGFAAVATIIRGVLGDIQGALSVGGPTQRLTATRRAELGAILCRAAERINPEF